MRTAIELNVAIRRIPPTDKDWIGINFLWTTQQGTEGKPDETKAWLFWLH